MKWLRTMLRRRGVCPSSLTVPEHPLSKSVVPILSKINGSRVGKTLFLALVVIDENQVVISEDPSGFLRSLARKIRKTPEQAFDACIQCARTAELVGPWRFFIVDEVLMGVRQQRLMATHVLYRSRALPSTPSEGSDA